jgi:uncharacterized protein YuzB (UPF0349 family)
MVSVYFSGQIDAIKEQLSKAKTCIQIAVAWMTFPLFLKELSDARDRGVEITILLTEIRGGNSTNAISNLKKKGVSIDVISPKTGVLMHHKFCIIDRLLVINGSFNWTESAKKNFENITIIENNPTLATEFITEFNELKVYTRSNYHLLKSSKPCSKCKCKKLMRFLVFDYHSINTHERYGDVIEYCRNCSSSKTIIDAIQDTGLNSHLNDIKEHGYTDLRGRQVASCMSGYTKSYNGIHAVGIVAPRDYTEEDKYTQILWKHRLFANKIESEYDSYFEVYYETQIPH